MPIINAPQPKLLTSGTGGTLRIGAVQIGTLQEWRLVVSPTTGRPTLIADARVLRAYLVCPPAQLVARITPTPLPAYIGRPKPPRPRPLVLTGQVARLQAGAVTLASCTYEAADKS